VLWANPTCGTAAPSLTSATTGTSPTELAADVYGLVLELGLVLSHRFPPPMRILPPPRSPHYPKAGRRRGAGVP
jgi:hypothetical protein